MAAKSVWWVCDLEKKVVLDVWWDVSVSFVCVCVKLDIINTLHDVGAFGCDGFVRFRWIVWDLGLDYLQASAASI